MDLKIHEEREFPAIPVNENIRTTVEVTENQKEASIMPSLGRPVLPKRKQMCLWLRKNSKVKVRRALE